MGVDPSKPKQEEVPVVCEEGMRLWGEYREAVPRGLRRPPVASEDVIDPEPKLAAFFEHWSACDSCNEV